MKIRRSVGGIVAGVLLAGSIAGLQHISFADELDDAKQERQRLEERKEEIETELADLENEKSGLLESIEKLDKKTANVNEQLTQVENDLAVATSELAELEEAYTEAEKTEEIQYDTMKKRIKYMYENGSSEYLDILFEAKSFGDMINRMEYVNKITAYDNKMLTQYQETKEDVENKKAAAAVKKEQYDVLLEEVQLEKDNLEKLTKAKQKKLEEYTTAIEDNEEAAKQYSEEIEKKEEEINALLLEAAKESGDGAATGILVNVGDGDFIWPLAVKGRISSHFGRRTAPTAGASTYHKGMDIAAPQGTDIYAVAGGTVTVATYSSSAGNYVMINHGNGVYTAYMHASELWCEVGDTVEQGEKIAEVGSTGVSTGAHLHIAFVVNGEYVDPEQYLPVR